MQYFKTILFASILTSASAAHAISDSYYSEGLYMDFKIAEDDKSIKQSLEVLFSKLISFVSDDDENLEGGFSVDLNYFTKSDK